MHINVNVRPLAVYVQWANGTIHKVAGKKDFIYANYNNILNEHCTVILKDKK